MIEELFIKVCVGWSIGSVVGVIIIIIVACIMQQPSVNPQKEGEYLKSAIRISKNIPKEMVEKVFFDVQEVGE